MSKVRSSFVGRVSSTWAAWIEPIFPHDAAQQQNLRLLASICLVTSLLSTFITLLSLPLVAANTLANPLFYVLVPLSLVTFIAYGLTRGGYVQAAVLLLTMFITTALYLTAIGADRPTPFFYLTISTFLISLVFSRAMVAFITLLQMVGMFLLIVLTGHFTFTQLFLGPALYLSLTTIFILLLWQYIEAREGLRRAALTRSENYLRSIIDNIPDHIYIKDLDHRFVMINRSVLQKYNFQHEAEIIGKTDRDTLGQYPDVDMVGLFQEEAEVFATGTPLINKECLGLVHSHKNKWLLVTKVPLRDNDGNITGLLGINRDVTALKNAESQVREREQTLQHIIDQMPVLFDAFDEQGNVVIWNGECERVTGYMAAEIVGQPDALSRLYPNANYLQDARATSSRLNHYYRNLEWELTCKDGSKRVIAWSNISREVPIPGWNSWCIGVDVTERKRAETEAMTLAVQTERLYLVGEFVRAVSHDFRTALANIQNNSYFIRRGVKTDDTSQIPDRLERIQENINRLVQQIDNLQTMASLQQIDMALTDINQILRAVVASQEDRFQAQSLTVLLTLNEHVPLVLADSDAVHQALHNLVDNAINHSPDGGILRLSSRHNGHFVYIDIGDQGAGIAEDKIHYIFDLFYRTDEARTLNRGGIGLGLSIVKLIADAHNGTIDVHSTPGQGSTFTLALPLQST